MAGDTVVVAAALAQKAGNGGHAWVVLQYLLGFRRLGWSVVFVDQLPQGGCDHETACRDVQTLMDRFGFSSDFALLGTDGRVHAGIDRATLLARTGGAAMLLNVGGFLRDEDVLGAAAQRVFLDIDPGFPQMWAELGLADVLRGHDRFVTVGARVGRSDCVIPTCGREWFVTAPPVVLSEWPVSATTPAGSALTTIATWRGAFAPIEFQGATYGLRVHEFRKFAAVPAAAAVPCEIALDIHPADARDRESLTAGGWSIVDPRRVAGNVDGYRSYIARSAAELTVAKQMYVATHSGWFSDRSACYLASGKPVIAQDTGFSIDYPTGEGLLAFRTADDAVRAVRAITTDYARHAAAARRLAEEYFDSDTVLPRLVSRLCTPAHSNS
jgi:hypothetical protein